MKVFKFLKLATRIALGDVRQRYKKAMLPLHQPSMRKQQAPPRPAVYILDATLQASGAQHGGV